MRARERGTRVSRREDEGVPNSYSSIDFERRFAIFVMAPEIGFGINSPLAGMAHGSGHVATENSVKAECDGLLEELNHFE